MTTMVALLRGINLGRARQVSMGDLRALVEELGYAGVRTHLRSGNVVLAADAAPQTVSRAIEQGIQDRLDMSVDVVVRTVDELADAAAANPFAGQEPDGARHFVMFFATAPERAAIEPFLTDEWAPDRLAAAGRELYLWCPEGMRDSRLATALGKQKGGPTGTMRNWNTVAKLLELARAATPD